MNLTEMPEGGALRDARKALERKGPIFRIDLGPDQLKQLKATKFAYEKERIEFGRRRHEQIAKGKAPQSEPQNSN